MAWVGLGWLGLPLVGMGRVMGGWVADSLTALGLDTALASHRGGHNLLPHEVALQRAACSGGGACGR